MWIVVAALLAGCGDCDLATGEVVVTCDEVASDIEYLRADEIRARRLLHDDTKVIVDLITRIALRDIADQKLSQLAASDRQAVLRKAQLPRVQEISVPPSAGKPVSLPRRMNLSHIFIREQSHSEAEAVSLLQHLRQRAQRGEDFAKLAREFSESSSATRDGRIGYVRPGWLPETVENALWELPEGAISGPIRAKGGWHVFYVRKKIDAMVKQPPPPVSKDDASNRHTRDLHQRNAILSQTIRFYAEQDLAPPAHEELVQAWNALDKVPRRPAHYSGRFLKIDVQRVMDSGTDPLAMWDALDVLSTEFDTESDAVGDFWTSLKPWREFSHPITLDNLPGLDAANLVPGPVFGAANRAGPGKPVGPIQHGEYVYVGLLTQRENAREMTFEEALPKLEARLNKEQIKHRRVELATQWLAAVDFSVDTSQQTCLEELRDLWRRVSTSSEIPDDETAGL